MQKMITVFIVTITTLGITGCQTIEWPADHLKNLSLIKHLSPDKGSAEEESFEEPVRMAVIWTDSVYSELGKPTVKGFGARLYFYNKDGEAIKVDGELVVYGYDDSSEKGHKSADRKYVYRKSEFQSHFSKSSLGSSYSVWVPWEKAGGVRKTVSLIPMFTTASGQLLKGDQSINVLPGKDPETRDDIASEIRITRDVQTAGYLGDNSNKVVHASGIEGVKPASFEKRASDQRRSRSYTIPMTRSMEHRLKTLPPQFFPRPPTANLASTAVGSGNDQTSNGESKSRPTNSVKAKPKSTGSSGSTYGRPVFGMPGATK